MGNTSLPFPTIDSITCEYRTVSGFLRRREVFKHLVERNRGWAVILFGWQDLRKKGHVPKAGWQPVRFAVERYRWVGFRWTRTSRFCLSQAQAIAVFGQLTELDADALVRAYEAKQAPANDTRSDDQKISISPDLPSIFHSM